MKSTLISIGSYNLYQRSNDKRADKALDVFATRVSIGNVQEYGGAERRQSLQDLRNCEFFKPRSVPTAPPIFWDKDRFVLLGAGARLVTEGRRVLKVPGKRAYLDDLYATGVVLQDLKTHRRIVDINWHAVAHIEHWPGARRKMNLDAVVSILDWMNDWKAKFDADLLAWGGDFNWSLTSEKNPSVVLGRKRAALVPMWHGHASPATHGEVQSRRGPIDGVLSNMACRSARRWLEPRVGDHFMVSGLFDMEQMAVRS